MASLLDLLGQTWPARLAKGAIGAAALPGDVYAGRVDPLSEEGIGKAADLAGMVMGGTFAGAPRGAMGAGPIRAYHGSPHDFERFDLSKIGTGEGAQAYGHGLYFAENEGVAKSYRDALAPRHQRGETLVNGQPLEALPPELQSKALNYWASGDKAHIAGTPLENATFEANPPGRMYEVNIHAQPEQFLSHDVPISQQSPEVQKALGSYMGGAYLETPNILPRSLIPTGAVGSKSLAEAGIPGIKYLDQGSRTAGQGSSNYVLFRDDIISIIRKYGWAGLGLFGISPDDAKAAGVEKGQGNNLRIGSKTYGE